MIAKLLAHNVSSTVSAKTYPARAELFLDTSRKNVSGHQCGTPIPN